MRRCVKVLRLYQESTSIHEACNIVLKGTDNKASTYRRVDI